MLNELLYANVISWDDIPEEGIRPGVVRRLYSTDEVTIAWHRLSRGMTLNPHTHVDFDQLVWIVEGECDYWVNGTPHRMGPGTMMLVPAGEEHYIEPVSETCVNIDVFAPPRADFVKVARRQLGQGD